MNVAVIVLAVILVVVLYFLYTNYVNSSSIKPIHLTEINQPVDLSLVSNPGSLRFSYSFWIYVNSLSVIPVGNATHPSGSPNGVINIFTVKNGDGQQAMQLNLDSQGNMSTNLYNGSGMSNIYILQNFPIQSWRYVVVSFDNSVMDIYLDGKIVRSQQLKNDNKQSFNYYAPTSPAQIKGSSVQYSQGADIFITKFQRLSSPMDPLTAWSYYSYGSGASSSMANYNLDLSITKNNQLQNTYHLF